MATYSGTYAYAPPVGELILLAFARCGIRRPSLTAEHFANAGNEANLALSKFANCQPLLWTSQLQSVPLVQGTATYTLPIEVVMILDIYIETTTGSSTVDRILGPVSTTEYDAFPDKVTQGPPTTYWFNRLITPQVTFWQPPDDTQSYTAKIRTVRQPQDSKIPSGIAPDIPYRYFDAYLAEVAYRLARIYAQPLEQMRKADAMEAWQIAATQDVENCNFYVIPTLAGYYR